MNRNATVLVVFGLLILADAFTAVQTLREQKQFVAQTMAAQLILGAALAWVAFKVFRKKYRRQKRPATRWRFALVQPLRRLFVSVWF